MKRVAVVSLVALAMAGCAVPGQSLSPGTAFAYDSVEVSNAQIDAIYQSWLRETEGAIVPNRLQTMTLEAVREPAIAMAIELVPDAAPSFTDEAAVEIAQQWLMLEGISDEPSQEVVDSAQAAFAVYVIAFADPGGSNIRALADEVAANVEGSPRAGVFDADTFVASVNNAVKSADGQALQHFSYTTFHNINGFVTPPSSVRNHEPE